MNLVNHIPMLVEENKMSRRSIPDQGENFIGKWTIKDVYDSHVLLEDKHFSEGYEFEIKRIDIGKFSISTNNGVSHDFENIEFDFVAGLDYSSTRDLRLVERLTGSIFDAADDNRHIFSIYVYSIHNKKHIRIKYKESSTIHNGDVHGD